MYVQEKPSVYLGFRASHSTGHPRGPKTVSPTDMGRCCPQKVRVRTDRKPWLSYFPPQKRKHTGGIIPKATAENWNWKSISSGEPSSHSQLACAAQICQAPLKARASSSCSTPPYRSYTPPPTKTESCWNRLFLLFGAVSEKESQRYFNTFPNTLVRTTYRICRAPGKKKRQVPLLKILKNFKTTSGTFNQHQSPLKCKFLGYRVQGHIPRRPVLTPALPWRFLPHRQACCQPFIRDSSLLW